jgi:YgiT-type zinc finger domain-containing protein
MTTTAMECVICRTGQTALGAATVTLQRGESVVVIKDVPAQVCADCGEYYLDEGVAERIHVSAEDAVTRHVEVAVLRFAAPGRGRSG